MARQSLLDLADKLHDGAVAEYVATRRAEGASFFSLATEVRDRFQVDVTPETIRRFLVASPSTDGGE